MEPLETKLAQLQTELKGYFDKAAEEKKTFGSLLEETKTAIAKVQAQCDAIDVKLAEKNRGGTAPRTFADELKENEDVQRLLKDRRGHIAFETKTLIDSSTVGAATSGVLQIERTPGIVTEDRRQLAVRSILSARPTIFQIIDFVKVNASLVKAEPQSPEGAAKSENAVTFTTASEKVKTIATWIPASRQILDDFSELESFLRTGLPYYVNMEEEDQLLFGTGAAEDLHGLCTQAQAYDTTLVSATDGHTKIDVIGRAVQQLAADNTIAPSFVILNPNDWWGMQLKKTSYGVYVLDGPSPQNGVRPSLFGLDVIVTTAMTSGKFLVGSGSPAAAEIRDRLGMTIDISTEHSTYFTENKVAIRAEKRLALVVYMPAAYVYGSLTQSPA